MKHCLTFVIRRRFNWTCYQCSAMEEKRVHLRHILLFYFYQGKNAAQAKQKICDVYGAEAITTTSCYNWYARFRSGNFNVEDAARSGRPSSIENDQILELIKVDRHLTAREIAEKLGICHSNVALRLQQMGLGKGRYMGADLTEEHK